MFVMSGCNKTLNTGISASVRKKFQCTPYSVTCSCIHGQQHIQLEKESKLRTTHRILCALHQHNAEQAKHQHRQGSF